MREIYKTDIERIVFNLLVENNIEFVFQYPIRCKYGYIADFFIPKINLIIEADGERWHNFQRDNRRDAVLRKKGFSILRLKGQDIKNNPNQCLELIIRRLNV